MAHFSAQMYSIMVNSCQLPTFSSLKMQIKRSLTAKKVVHLSNEMLQDEVVSCQTMASLGSEIFFTDVLTKKTHTVNDSNKHLKTPCREGWSMWRK